VSGDINFIPRRVLVSEFLSFYDRKRCQLYYLMLYRLLIVFKLSNVDQLVFLFHERKKLLKKNISFSNNLIELKHEVS